MAASGRTGMVLGGLVVVLLGGFGLLLMLPAVLGAAYAVGGFPVYGAVCNKVGDLFSGTIQPGDYHAFLMNRGCTQEIAIRDSVANYCSSNPSAVLSEYYGQGGGGAEHMVQADQLRIDLQRFKWPDSVRDCNAPDWAAYPPENEFIRTFKWWAGLLDTGAFYTAVGAMVGLLVGFIQQGPIFGGLVFLGYGALAALVGSAVVKWFSGKGAS